LSKSAASTTISKQEFASLRECNKPLRLKTTGGKTREPLMTTIMETTQEAVIDQLTERIGTRNKRFNQLKCY
jgi:hypothetical protein